MKLELLLHHYDDWEIGEVVNYKSYDMYSFEVSEEKDILEAIESKFYGGVKVPVYKFLLKQVIQDLALLLFSVNSGNPWSMLILMIPQY